MHVSVRVRVPDPQVELQDDQDVHRAHFDQEINTGKSLFLWRQYNFGPIDVKKDNDRNNVKLLRKIVYPLKYIYIYRKKGFVQNTFKRERGHLYLVLNIGLL